MQYGITKVDPNQLWNAAYLEAFRNLKRKGASEYWRNQGAMDWAEWVTFGKWRDRYLPSMGFTKYGFTNG